MLIYDLQEIGNRIYAIRKSKGLTQEAVAEKADISPRSYADFERGSVNMRIESMLKICGALGITPDSIFTKENETQKEREEEIQKIFESLSPHEKETSLALLKVYFKSLSTK